MKKSSNMGLKQIIVQEIATGVYVGEYVSQCKFIQKVYVVGKLSGIPEDFFKGEILTSVLLQII